MKLLFIELYFKLNGMELAIIMVLQWQLQCTPKDGFLVYVSWPDFGYSL